MQYDFLARICLARMIAIGLLFQATALLQATALAQQGPWPQWRGPGRDDLSTETGLLESWPEGGPKKLWTIATCGLGYSGPAIVDGRLYILGSRSGSEMVFCYNAKNGAEIWKAPLGPELKNDWGNGPRGTPTVDMQAGGKFLYTVGGQGNLVCLRTKDGSEVWSKAMQDFGGITPRWGYSESPLIDQEKLLYTPGGKQGAIVALDKATGKLLWQTEEITDRAHYSSIVVKQHAGKTMGVQLLVSQVVGFDLEDGTVLWTVPWGGSVAVVPTPVFWEDCVYVTSGYGAGCMLVRIADDWTAEVVYDSNLISNHHGGVILLGEHLYGHSNRKGWTCQNIATGKNVWQDRRKLGKGAIAYADERFYCLDEDTGEVAIIAASSKGWKEHGRFTLQPQSELRSPQGRIWTHPVIADGRLYLRDQELLYCFDVRAEK